MKLISFSTKSSEPRPGFLLDDTNTILDLSPSGYSSKTPWMRSHAAL